MSENPYRQDNPFINDMSYRERCKNLEAAIQVMAQELATWRSMPHLDHVEYSYWADVANEHLMVIGGYSVNENIIAKQAVDKAKNQIGDIV